MRELYGIGWFAADDPPGDDPHSDFARGIGQVQAEARAQVIADPDDSARVETVARALAALAEAVGKP